MAGIIDGPWNPALDGNGDPYAASVIEFYQSGTTTPLSAYPTAADADAGTNGFTSKTADSAGRFTPTFGPDAESYRIIWKASSGGATIYTYDHVRPQADMDALTYDFDSHGRYRVFGADGKVQIETGDAAGDNSGGDARIGGWESTQGDTLEIDYATATFTGDAVVEGDDFTVAGKPVGTYRLLGGAVSSSSALDIALPSGYEWFVLRLQSVVVGTDAAYLMLRGKWSGAFVAANYVNQGVYVANGSAANGFGAGLTDAIYLSRPIDIGTGRNDSVVEFDCRGLRSFVQSGYTGDNSGSAVTEGFWGGGWNPNNQSPATDIRILASTGTFSCTYTLYGMKGLVQGQSS